MRVEIEVSDEEAAQLQERFRLWGDVEESRYTDLGWKLTQRAAAALAAGSPDTKGAQ